MDTTEKRAALLAKIEKLKAQEKVLRQKESAAKHKKETRAKIILGGAMIALLRKESEDAFNFMPQLLNSMSPRDRKVFLEWREHFNKVN